MSVLFMPLVLVTYEFVIPYPAKHGLILLDTSPLVRDNSARLTLVVVLLVVPCGVTYYNISMWLTDSDDAFCPHRCGRG